MRVSGRRSNYYIFIFVSGALCILYALLFRPITYEAQGDYPAYLDLARQIFGLPGAGTELLTHRSPLYSIVLGGFMLIFGEAHFLVPLMILQYLLIFISSLIIYRIIIDLTGRSWIAFIAGLAGILNLTTIYFGYMMVTETLALFLFTLTVYLLSGYLKRGSPGLAFASGAAAALLILTRFNTLGLPAVIIAVIVVIHFIREGLARIGSLMAGLSVFTVSLLAILSLWSLYNYRTNGKFELLPRQHTGQRWAVPGTINASNSVGPEYEEVFKIFLEAKAVLIDSGKENVKKGSLLSNSMVSKLNDRFRPQVSGFLLYREAKGPLLEYYHLDAGTEGIRMLGEKLAPFYEIIARQNKAELSRLRFYSFIYTFKHISPTLPGNTDLNLNRLPASVIKIYKLLFMAVILSVYGGSVIHFLRMVFKKGGLRAGSDMLVLYGMIWYFPLSNWYANVLGDAGRFRYPADILIIGIFIAGCWFVFRELKSRYRWGS